MTRLPGAVFPSKIFIGVYLKRFSKMSFDSSVIFVTKQRPFRQAIAD
jgi:hypothetical protein